MACDLAKDGTFNVTAADISDENLDKIPGNLSVVKKKLDFTNSGDLQTLLKEYDLVLSAVPGFMGASVLKEIIKAGKNVVDISFFPEDPFEFDELAKQNNVTAIVDCGVAPGMSNLLAGYVDSLLDSTESILIYVGGLPLIREYPFEYKAVFSPIDVIEEYTRPARYVEYGRTVIRPALSDPEFLDFPGVGTLEAFNSDGLRTLATTLHVPNMKEKTLRYIGHIDKMLFLRESGYFSKDEIMVNGNKVRPIEVTAKLLFPKWKMNDTEVDITIMRVIVLGIKDGKQQRFTYNLLDRKDGRENIHSMARTTGFTATTVLRMLSKSLYNRKGISPPEYIGQKHECVEFVLHGLKEYGIEYLLSVEALD